MVKIKSMNTQKDMLDSKEGLYVNVTAHAW